MPAAAMLKNKKIILFINLTYSENKNTIISGTPCELLRLIEVGASCFIHRCTGSDIRYTMSYTMSTGV